MDGRHQVYKLQHLTAIQPEFNLSWRCKNILPRNGVAFVYGAPSVGKSFATIYMGLAIASGNDVAGQRTKQCGVLYIAAEAGEGIKSRIAMAKSSSGISDDAPFSLLVAAPNLGRDDIDASELLAAIRQDEELHNIKYEVVIIDTLARVTAGYDENSSKDVGQFVRNADYLARELNALIIAVHHSGKNEEGGMRGSSALLGAADAVFKVSRRNDYTWFQIEKQRDGADNLGFSFKLKPVQVGKDSEGEIITTCVLDEISNLQMSDEASLKKKKSTIYIQCMSSFEAFIKSCKEKVPVFDGIDLNAVEKERFYSFYNSENVHVKSDTRRKRLDRFVKDAVERKELGSSQIGGVDVIWRIP